MMPQPQLHYVFDPLCGWCYGAAPLIAVAQSVLPVHLHGGGMMAGPARRPVTPELRRFVLPHDRRIAALSGQPFGAAYTDGLLGDAGAVFDSGPPTAAILAAEAVAGRGLDLLARIQTAHFVDGRRIAEAATLLDLAAAIGLPDADFAAAFAAVDAAALDRHFADSRALLARAGSAGFPTVLLAQGTMLTRLDVGPFLGQPEAWAAHLQAQLPHVRPAH